MHCDPAKVRALAGRYTSQSFVRPIVIEPPLPLDETARLMSLHSLRILDTPSEDRFDRITRMARRLFGVEISLISLVDSHRAQQLGANLFHHDIEKT